MASPCPITSLPNEILISIFNDFPSNELPIFAPVNRQFYAIIVNIIHGRLLKAVPLADNQMILEAYHPSARFYTPYLSCKYQDLVSREGPALYEYSVPAPLSPSLGDMKKLYGSYRPVLADENRATPRIRFGFPRPRRMTTNDDDKRALHQVSLDEGELFSQLCSVVNVVKEGPRNGLFITHVNVMNKVIRIFRNWLFELANSRPGEMSDEARIIWLDHAKDTGIRFRLVNLVAPDGPPAVANPFEDPPVSYTLEYEELLVRANKVLQACDRSAAQERDEGSGKTLIISANAI